MRVYVDVTCYMRTAFMSGIQRVVRELLLRMGNRREFELITLEYDGKCKKYRVIDVQNAINRKQQKNKEKIEICDMQREDVFFDIDACWNVSPQRSTLYPKLKEYGVRIVTYIQDILPITHPEYFGKLGNWAFLGYVGACLNYADKIVVTTKATENSLLELITRVEKNNGENGFPSILPVATEVVALGGDLQDSNHKEEGEVDSDAFQFVQTHDGEYVFMAGTIEPRKNHAVILKAFETSLFEKGVSLVIAGRVGWNCDQVMSRIHAAQENSNFLFAEGKNSATIRYLYQHAKVVAFPSFDEGYGLPIIEAMSYGVPVIAGDVPVLREVGRDACIYCSVYDSLEWEKVISDLFEKKEIYQSLKEKAENYKPLTWNETADQLCVSLAM